MKERLKWGTDRATKALQEWRSLFLTQGYRNAEHACTVCGELLPTSVIADGFTTHPTCEDA